MPEQNVPTTLQKAPPTSISSDRKPVRGDWVLWRDHDCDCDAIVARVHPDGTLVLAVLGGGGNWFVRDRVARDRTGGEKDGIKIQGLWRWKD